MKNKSFNKIAMISYVPSWLWLWATLSIFSLTSWFEHFRISISELLNIQFSSSASSLFGQIAIADLATQGLTILFAYLCILSAAFPKIRCHLIESYYHLEPPPKDYPLPVLEEITSFIEHCDPDVRIMACLADERYSARIYPHGYLKSTIAIFGGLIKVWDKDRSVGENIILHELSHKDNGDTLIFGIGSPISIISVALLFASIISFLAAFGQIWQLSINNEFVPSTSNLLAATIARIFYSIAFFLPPIFAIWAAELLADHSANFSDVRRARYIDWLKQPRTGKSIAIRAQNLIAHPPQALRIWMLKRHHKWYCTALLLLIFPISYALRLICLIIWGTLNALSFGVPIEVRAWTDSYIQSFGTTLTAISCTALLWPIAKYLYLKIKYKGMGFRFDYRIFSINLFISLLFIISAYLGWSPSNFSDYQAQVITDKYAYQPNEPVLVRYSGLPGESQDWITVVEEDAPEQTWGQWTYTDGKEEGEFFFHISTPGTYEVRAFFDWPSGGYEVQAKTTFLIEEKGEVSNGNPSDIIISQAGETTSHWNVSGESAQGDQFIGQSEINIGQDNAVTGSISGYYEINIQGQLTQYDVFNYIEGRLINNSLHLDWTNPLDNSSGTMLLNNRNDHFEGAWESIGGVDTGTLVLTRADDSSSGRSLHEITRRQDIQREANSLLQTASATNDQVEAIRYYQASAKLFEEIEDWNKLGYALYGWGAGEATLGNYDTASDLYERVLELGTVVDPTIRHLAIAGQEYLQVERYLEGPIQ